MAATTSVTKENVFSTIRAVFIFLGVFLIGKNVKGVPIDSQTWEIVTGAIVSLIMVGWGFVTKDTGLDQLQSLLRSALTGLGGYLVAIGVLKGDVLQAILSSLPSIFALIQSFTNKAQVVQISKNMVTPQINDSGKPNGKLVNVKPAA